ncbi:hypothetical protein BHM03_00019150 [Ensete ventricosum]|uniref:B3/B4 tRNA-binding domain-containing protein n=1 Tax=Ensete ventricosum TaxID=4639 RepID=A0A445MFL8_ENSVE|nr:hypothetical protein BHM03_00019150 [Ensete ventricosum]
MLRMHVKPEFLLVHGICVGYLVKFFSFSNTRRRTLVAIGTHDLDTIQGPFTYEALPPQEINFVPLKQVQSFRADDLLEYYKVTMFSEYCENKFEIEPVEVVNSDGKSNIYPDLSIIKMEVPLSDLVDPIGISLDATEVLISAVFSGIYFTNVVNGLC